MLTEVKSSLFTNIENIRKAFGMNNSILKSH